MRFWFREVAGWLLLGLGLVVFYIAFALLMNVQPIEATPVTVIGIILFRGGIHLLKVAVAAQVCTEAQERSVREQAAPAPRRPPGAPSRRFGEP